MILKQLPEGLRNFWGKDGLNTEDADFFWEDFRDILPFAALPNGEAVEEWYYRDVSNPSMDEVRRDATAWVIRACHTLAIRACHKCVTHLTRAPCETPDRGYTAPTQCDRWPPAATLQPHGCCATTQLLDRRLEPMLTASDPQKKRVLAIDLNRAATVAAMAAGVERPALSLEMLLKQVASPGFAALMGVSGTSETGSVGEGQTICARDIATRLDGVVAPPKPWLSKEVFGWLDQVRAPHCGHRFQCSH